MWGEKASRIQYIWEIDYIVMQLFYSKAYQSLCYHNVHH